MGGQAVQPNGLMQYVIPIAVIAIVFLIRGRQMTRMRRLKLEQLWIVPAIYLVIVAAVFATTPPTAKGWLAAVVALAVGAVLGWQRGRLMAIHVDPETHSLSQRASPLAMLFLFAIVLVRMAAQSEGRAMHLDVQLVTDAALALALGNFAVTRLEMYLRGKRLLAAVRANR
ncbi:CcdC protein domain-containing protein [Sphingomonas bacterium]|nr:CcdC protein domain-containing protein [Sphingomonas bacterium]